MGANPIQMQKFLRGVTYPASRDELVEHARRNGADDAVLHRLESMADRKYAGSTAASVEYAKHRPDESSGAPTESALLGIYLNDHLAGAVAGSNLARRLADAEQGWSGGDVLRRIAQEIEEDLAALREIMAAQGVVVRQYKVWAAWAVERVGRLKLNGRLLSRSPLSRVVELEAMRLGVEGKAAGWRALRARAAVDSRLEATRLDELIARAHGQIDELERLRVRAAVEAFGGSTDAVNTETTRGG